MRIAILGATSQIARDLILSFSAQTEFELILFARRPNAVQRWLSDVGLSARCTVSDYGGFAVNERYDAIMNFVGSGNPAQTAEIGASIFDITLKFDDLALEYVRHHPSCRYLFFSSGAAYGSSFEAPVNDNTKATVAINDLQPQDWYAVAKLHSECRHRSLTNLPIIDLRIFNYFSHRQDISARFFITDILRAIREGETLFTTRDNIVRDYIGPDDLFQLIVLILTAPVSNDVVDCYTQAPVDKLTLLKTMREQFGLVYEFRETPAGVNATGLKVNYYSVNHKAEAYGYYPSRNSLDNILYESKLMLSRVS